VVAFAWGIPFNISDVTGIDYIVFLYPLIEIVSMIMGPPGSSLHDRIAGTRVVLASQVEPAPPTPESPR
jgi:hypothetical protein